MWKGYWSPLCALLSLWPDLQRPGSGSSVAGEAAGAFSRREWHRDRTSPTGLPILPRGSLPDAEDVGWAGPAGRRPATPTASAATAERTEKDEPGTGCPRARDELRLYVVAQTGASFLFVTKYWSRQTSSWAVSRWSCKRGAVAKAVPCYGDRWTLPPPAARRKLQTTENKVAIRLTKLHSTPKTALDLYQTFQEVIF